MKEVHLFIKIKENGKSRWLQRIMPSYESSVSGWVQNQCSGPKRYNIYQKHKLVILD